MLRMSYSVFLTVVFFAAAVSAVTDSVDYGNNTMEWRRFDADEPVVSFTESRGALWYATSSGVGVYAAKTFARSMVASLGGFAAEGVNDIVSDTKSGIWFATGEGAAYTSDGKQFTNYSADNGLCNNNVKRILISADGTVWAGTEKGVSAFKAGAWKSYALADGLCGMNIRDIATDGKAVYFATNNGIAVYSSDKWSKYDKASGLSSNDVKTIACDVRKGEIWAAVGLSDVNTFDGKTWNVFMDVQEGILCIMTDTQSRIWVGSSSGFIKYNGFEWVYDPAKMPFAAAQCSRMNCDDSGNLWFAIEAGVIKLNNPYPY
jgi:ligand-binding sensor domain-containing protein